MFFWHLENTSITVMKNEKKFHTLLYAMMLHISIMIWFTNGTTDKREMGLFILV